MAAQPLSDQMCSAFGGDIVRRPGWNWATPEYKNVVSLPNYNGLVSNYRMDVDPALAEHLVIHLGIVLFHEGEALHQGFADVTPEEWEERTWPDGLTVASSLLLVPEERWPCPGVEEFPELDVPLYYNYYALDVWAVTEEGDQILLGTYIEQGLATDYFETA